MSEQLISLILSYLSEKMFQEIGSGANEEKLHQLENSLSPRILKRIRELEDTLNDGSSAPRFDLLDAPARGLYKIYENEGAQKAKEYAEDLLIVWAVVQFYSP